MVEEIRALAAEVETLGHCQVDEKLVDQPSRYWAPARRDPAMLGIKNGRQSQLDNTLCMTHGILLSRQQSLS